MAVISVVVIGRNEGQRLKRCLESVRRMRGVAGGTELIYVDSASADGSVALAGGFGAQVLSVAGARPTAALGRNAGWRQAKGEFVLFLDGDTVLHEDFARLALERMQADGTLAAVWGHRREIHPEQSVYNRILDLDWVYPPGLTEFCGGDVLMRRKALDEAGGYDAELIAGEEPELCRRMRSRGYGILHIDAAMTGHDLQMTRFGQYWKRATRAGHAYAEVSGRFRGTEDPFWEDVRRANLIRGGFWMGSLVLAVGWSGLARSIWPVAGWLAILTMLAARSGWKARWKGGSGWTLFLYGLHSHLQQVPICIGQLRYEIDLRRGKQRKLIEYKSSGDV